MTPRRPPHLDPKGRGNHSMVGKRERSEDVYGMVLQRLHDRVRAALPEPQCPVVEPHTRREHVCIPDAIGRYGIGFLPCHALTDGRCVANACKGMNGAPTSCSHVPLVRNMGGPTRRESHGPGVLVVPKAECCHSLTQTDRKVCRWLADHRTGDPGRGRAGEGEQVARGPATGRGASCAEATADLVIIQAWLGGGHWRAA